MTRCVPGSSSCPPGPGTTRTRPIRGFAGTGTPTCSLPTCRPRPSARAARGSWRLWRLRRIAGLRRNYRLPARPRPLSREARHNTRLADRHARMDWRDTADRIEPALANEPTEKKQAKEATEPIDRTDPAEPMLRIEPEEPIDRIDPLDPMLRIEPAEPPDRPDLPLIPMPRFSQPIRQWPSRGFRSASA